MSVYETNYFSETDRTEQNEQSERRDTHNFTVDRDSETPPRERANFDCPQCDRELVPGPGNSWICWVCGDVIYVEGGGRR